MVLPWGHWILIFVGWASFALYIVMIIIFVKNHNKVAMLCSSYLYLFFAHSFIECVLFLVVEFLMRPRRWAWIPIFTEDMKLLAEVNYAFILISRIALSFGQVVCAFNRFSVVGFDCSSYNKMWSPLVIALVFIGCWWIGFVIVVPVAISYKDDIYFKNLPGGTIQLFGGRFTEFESLFMAPFCIVIIIVISVFYTAATLKFRGATSVKVERRLLLCGVLSAFPFVLETIRSIFGIASYILDDSTLFVMGGDLWFYEAELSFSFQVWVHALLLRPIRDKLLFWRRTSQHTSTISVLTNSRNK